MAARNIAIQFGELVNIPAKMVGAIITAPDLANLCPGQPDKPEHDPSPLKAPKSCPECGEITDHSVLLKGVKQGSTYTIVTQDELADAKVSYSGEYKGKISLVAHPVDEFVSATAAGEKLYYLTPATDKLENQYQTLVAFISAHPELAFVGLYTPVSATGLYRVSVRGGVLVMEERARSQALKEAPTVGGTPMQKLQMFLEMELEDSLVAYDPDTYEDQYATALQAMVAESDRATTGGKVLASTPVAMSDDDLVAKLEALREKAAA